jgi:hypothetical protein
MNGHIWRGNALAVLRKAIRRRPTGQALLLGITGQCPLNIGSRKSEFPRNPGRSNSGFECCANCIQLSLRQRRRNGFGISFPLTFLSHKRLFSLSPFFHGY